MSIVTVDATKLSTTEGLWYSFFVDQTIWYTLKTSTL